jgi:hypothetical protein
MQSSLIRVLVHANLELLVVSGSSLIKGLSNKRRIVLEGMGARCGVVEGSKIMGVGGGK